jgi:hypothetical protein
MAVISYWGKPNKISESVKTLSPKIVLPTWDQGLPPLLIKSLVELEEFDSARLRKGS